ncbi:iron ABC transporter permease [Roseiflexus castenholzii]|uniref:ABC transporter permease n=1 Tax=Roseiflexus castenholzii TaxID=120962 RepID=UPI0023540AB7
MKRTISLRSSHAMGEALMVWRASSVALRAAAILVGALAIIPLAYILIRALEADATVWERLWSRQIPALAGNTLALTVTTVALSTLFGVGAAWLVERTDLPGARVWRVLLALPLAIPAYVAAICWLILLRRGGVIDQIAMEWMGFARGAFPLPQITNLWGATMVISLCVFPYVFLPVGAVLRSLDRSLEEAARMAGLSAWTTLWRVVLPLAMPAAAGGALLVGLYALSDFGTVAMLRYRTFTLAIFQQFAGQVDRSAAAILSFVLIGMAIPVLYGAAWMARRERQLTRTRWQPPRLTRLGRWQPLALLAIGGLTFFSLGLPLLTLGGLTLQGWLVPTAVDRIWGVNNAGVLRYALNSVGLAATAATGAIALAIFPALVAVRQPGRWSSLLLAACQSPFALPGIIIGLSFVLLFNRWMPMLYGTLAVLVIGFVFRLLPQAVTANESALRVVSPSLEQAARTLGDNGIRAFQRVTFPVAAPGLLAGWVLCFVTAMKELPTVILLRPPGFDTLPVRIWVAASESVHTQAAPSAFALIAVTIVTLLIVTHYQAGMEKVLSHS